MLKSHTRVVLEMTYTSKTLALCIVSNNRPFYLEHMLASLVYPIASIENINVFVFDNSIGTNAIHVADISDRYGAKLFYLQKQKNNT